MLFAPSVLSFGVPIQWGARYKTAADAQRAVAELTNSVLGDKTLNVVLDPDSKDGALFGQRSVMLQKGPQIYSRAHFMCAASQPNCPPSCRTLALWDFSHLSAQTAAQVNLRIF